MPLVKLVKEIDKSNFHLNCLRIIMPATEPLCHLAGLNPAKLSKEENLIIEVELFTRIYEALREECIAKHKNYLPIIRFNTVTENEIMEAKVARDVVNDILSTEEYTLSGIACYTQTPEDVVYEVALGLNTNPSATFLRKIIELHRSIRRDLYSEIIKKIVTEYLACCNPASCN